MASKLKKALSVRENDLKQLQIYAHPLVLCVDKNLADLEQVESIKRKNFWLKVC